MAVKKRSVKQELKYLWIMELLDCLFFWIAYFSMLYVIKSEGAKTGTTSLLFALCILSVILLEGSFYWFNCVRRLEKKKALPSKIIAPLYEFFRIFNYVLIVSYIPILFLNKNEARLIIIVSLITYIFSILEQINYFHFRLSYYTKSGIGLKIFYPLKNLILGKAPKSKIVKEILDYKRQKNKENINI